MSKNLQPSGSPVAQNEEDRKINIRTGLLFQAIMDGDDVLANEMISQGVDFEMIRSVSKEEEDEQFENTPLTYAVKMRRSGIVRALLEAGADVNGQDDSNSAFAIIHCVTNFNPEMTIEDPNVSSIEDPEILKILIDAGADLEVESAGMTPLMWAIEFGMLDKAMILISNGADLTAISGDFGDHVIHRLTMNLWNDLISEVLKNNPEEVNCANDDGDTPLHLICDPKNFGESSGYEDFYLNIIELLLENGADIHQENELDFSPLATALLKIEDEEMLVLAINMMLKHEYKNSLSEEEILKEVDEIFTTEDVKLQNEKAKEAAARIIKIIEERQNGSEVEVEAETGAGARTEAEADAVAQELMAAEEREKRDKERKKKKAARKRENKVRAKMEEEMVGRKKEISAIAQEAAAVAREKEQEAAALEEQRQRRKELLEQRLKEEEEERKRILQKQMAEEKKRAEEERQRVELEKSRSIDLVANEAAVKAIERAVEAVATENRRIAARDRELREQEAAASRAAAVAAAQQKAQEEFEQRRAISAQRELERARMAAAQEARMAAEEVARQAQRRQWQTGMIPNTGGYFHPMAQGYNAAAYQAYPGYGYDPRHFAQHYQQPYPAQYYQQQPHPEQPIVDMIKYRQLERDLAETRAAYNRLRESGVRLRDESPATSSSATSSPAPATPPPAHTPATTRQDRSLLTPAKTPLRDLPPSPENAPQAHDGKATTPRLRRVADPNKVRRPRPFSTIPAEDGTTVSAPSSPTFAPEISAAKEGRSVYYSSAIGREYEPPALSAQRINSDDDGFEVATPTAQRSPDSSPASTPSRPSKAAKNFSAKTDSASAFYPHWM